MKTERSLGGSPIVVGRREVLGLGSLVGGEGLIEEGLCSEVMGG